MSRHSPRLAKRAEVVDKIAALNSAMGMIEHLVKASDSLSDSIDSLIEDLQPIMGNAETVLNSKPAIMDQIATCSQMMSNLCALRNKLANLDERISVAHQKLEL